MLIISKLAFGALGKLSFQSYLMNQIEQKRT